MQVEVDHPFAERTPLVANPIKYSKTPIQKPQAPPLLGANLQEVLTEVLDYSAEKIAGLQANGVV